MLWQASRGGSETRNRFSGSVTLPERNEHPLALPASPASWTVAPIKEGSASNPCRDQLSNFATTKHSLEHRRPFPRAVASRRPFQLY
jgi:hypothetical protein